MNKPGASGTAAAFIRKCQRPYLRPRHACPGDPIRSHEHDVNDLACEYDAALREAEGRGRQSAIVTGGRNVGKTLLARAEKAEAEVERLEQSVASHKQSRENLSKQYGEKVCEIERLKAAKIAPCQCRPGPQLECDECGGWY